VGEAEAASPALRKDLRLQSENEELMWLFEFGMNAIRYDLIWDEKLNYRALPWAWEAAMKASGCPFCHNLEPQLASNHHAFSILDSRPVTPGHSLVISRNHAPTVFDLPPVEFAACFELVRELRELLVQKWKTKSLSIVMNCGAEANQTIQHAHIHLVPRHRDVPLPPAADVWSSLK
jgi:diadenosine tetraphosphate (Ap4A) HIT family hydrolase